MITQDVQILNEDRFEQQAYNNLYSNIQKIREYENNAVVDNIALTEEVKAIFNEIKDTFPALKNKKCSKYIKAITRFYIEYEANEDESLLDNYTICDKLNMILDEMSKNDEYLNTYEADMERVSLTVLLSRFNYLFESYVKKDNLYLDSLKIMIIMLLKLRHLKKHKSISHTLTGA